MPATLADWISTGSQFVILVILIWLRRMEQKKYRAMNERMDAFFSREVEHIQRMTALESVNREMRRAISKLEDPTAP